MVKVLRHTQNRVLKNDLPAVAKWLKFLLLIQNAQ